jgi:ribosomal protein S18 acetylase RimI-like enzyme
MDVKLAARPLEASDLDAVVAIDASIVGRTRRGYFERRLASALRQPKLHAQFAIVEGDGLAGYVLGRVLDGEFGRFEPALRLETIGVKREVRGRGLGLALEAALEQAARRQGLAEMRTGASWREHAMLRFLDGAGYRLASSRVIECSLAQAKLGSRDEEPVVIEERDRPGDRNDYGSPAPERGEHLARDLAEVRSLTDGDLEAVTRIDRHLTGQDRAGYMRGKLDEALNDSAIRISLVALKDGAAAGYLMAAADYGDFGRPEPVAVIDTIGVDPGFAHAGIGRALLSQLFINLAALRVERVETVLATEHFDLLRFLYRAGFGPSQRLAFVKKLGGQPA